MLRLIAGLFSLKLIGYLAALWFVWSTMGTTWTILIAYGLAVFGLWKWGPDEPKDPHDAPWTLAPTRGRPYAFIAPLVVCVAWPLSVLAMCGAGLATKGPD